MNDQFTFVNDGNSSPESTSSPQKRREYAGFWIRFLALFIDGIIILIPSLIFNLIIPYAGGILLSFMYKVFFECSRLQGTPGKALLGISVVDVNGERIGLRQAAVRYFGTLISSAVLFLGYLFAIFTERRQTLHDILANTLVIYQAPPKDVNYLDIWVNEIQDAFATRSGKSNSDVASHSSTSKPPQTSAPPLTPETSTAQKLEELHELYKRGLITENDFNLKKEEILKRI